MTEEGEKVRKEEQQYGYSLLNVILSKIITAVSVSLLLITGFVIWHKHGEKERQGRYCLNMLNKYFIDNSV